MDVPFITWLKTTGLVGCSALVATNVVLVANVVRLVACFTDKVHAIQKESKLLRIKAHYAYHGYFE